jgi:hypothetical protein
LTKYPVEVNPVSLSPIDSFSEHVVDEISSNLRFTADDVHVLRRKYDEGEKPSKFAPLGGVAVNPHRVGSGCRHGDIDINRPGTVLYPHSNNRLIAARTDKRHVSARSVGMPQRGVHDCFDEISFTLSVFAHQEGWRLCHLEALAGIISPRSELD